MTSAPLNLWTKLLTKASIGAALRHHHGQRVLLVDLDPQANLTDNLLGRGVALDGHIGNAIIDVVLGNVLIETAAGVDLAPACFELAQYEALIPLQKHWRHRLAKTLATVQRDYDFVLLDCPPTLQTFTQMALVAADAYLIPTEPEKFAFDGLRTVTEVADGVVESLNPRLQFLGVCFTRYNPRQRNSMHAAVVQAVTQQYGPAAVLPAIRRDAAVVKSQVQTKTVFDLNPAGNAATDYAALTRELVARLA